MPNSLQLVFVGSFLATSAALFTLHSWAISALRNAGYDPANIILIGLPGHEVYFMDNLKDTLRTVLPNTVDVPGVGAVNVVDLVASPAVLVASVVVLVTAVYVKLFHTGRTKPLDPAVWKEFPLQEKIQVSPNTAIYRFKLPHPQDVLGLPTGQHITVTAEINGKAVTRSYTPISNDDDTGRFDLIVKTYEKGNISRHIANLKIGDKLRVKGPKGAFQYAPNMVDHLAMIAGGTGIAPMMQVIRAVLKNPFDNTKVTLIYANVNEEDILLKNDLEELADLHGSRFTIFYVLNNPPPGWTGGAGFVTGTHIKERFPNLATTNSKLLICGPPPMVGAMKKNLADLEYPTPETISKTHHKVFVF